jgi:hypothetical protein
LDRIYDGSVEKRYGWNGVSNGNVRFSGKRNAECYEPIFLPYIYHKNIMRELLLEEGLTDAQITLDRDNIIRTDDGILSWRNEYGYPYISHLVVARPRNFYKGLRLYIEFRSIIGKGTEFIAEVIPEKPYFERLIKFIDKDARLYAEKQGIKYYLVKAVR